MIAYSRPKRSDLHTQEPPDIPYPRVNCLKTIPFTATHTYIAHIWQYPPGYRLSECRAWYLLTHSLLLSVLCWKPYSFCGTLVRFLPHLLMHKYHVLSMKYFVDVTLLIPN